MSTVEIQGAFVSFSDATSDQDAADRHDAAAFPPSEHAIEGEAEAYIATIDQLSDLSYPAAKKLIEPVPLPDGYAHFRLFRKGEDSAFFRTFKVAADAKPITQHNVLFGVLASPGLQVTEWRGARVIKTEIPGVLDIEIDFSDEAVIRPASVRL